MGGPGDLIPAFTGQARVDNARLILYTVGIIEKGGVLVSVLL